MSEYKALYDHTDCPICNSQDGEHCQKLPGRPNYELFDCYVCGKFRVSDTAMSDFYLGRKRSLSPSARASLSFNLRRLNDSEDFSVERVPMLTSDHIERIQKATQMAPDPLFQMRLLLQQIGAEFRHNGHAMVADGRTRARIGSIDQSQMNSIVRLAEEAKLVRNAGDRKRLNTRGGTTTAPSFELTALGWQELGKFRDGLAPGRYGFLAMKFGDAILDELVASEIKPLVKSKLDLDVIDLRDVARAGIIDNLMRERIRDCAFMLCDLSHDNSGAYWEAGYAEGLGKPVIYLCETGKFAEKKTHFDTNHCTTVLWGGENAARFPDELIATVRRSLNLF